MSASLVAVTEVPLAPTYLWPYGVALMALIGFGILGFKAGQPWLLWAIGGAGCALVTATIASGLANAIALPYTDAVMNRNQLIAFTIVVPVYILVGFQLAFLPNSKRSI